ncbi:MAG: IMS domain-containing protein [Cyanobacteriota bacterium]|nr:IMS domain-containing protein [Cyanobacteriota bacterium]
MRIPLDYYRILGVPVQATEAQLNQAHRDRVLQLPRREYSDAAIEARKQLVDEAYSVLSDSQQRSEYDARFFAQPYESEPKSAGELARSQSEDDQNPTPRPPTPSIEIEPHQLVGALLILLELGEYELVLKLGQPYLEQQPATTESEQLVRADIVLTVALTSLELGREQWQHGQSENAALSGQMGQELLLREGLFPQIRGEIQADLYRLRPYRILELLAMSETDSLKRRKGLQILREMLNERGGIDGQGDDRSGLSVDDFLRFIQQIRNYLTVAEQQTLFEAEARRPSAVATYLAVYALLARGFAERKPVEISRARSLLQRLGKRQDVYLEQAVCALLLGQPEQASHALELSRESEPLDFIREHSQDSPDLLPGLCLYGERWLQSEVFPHFRDLAVQQVSLKDYFADEQVQGYLEQLPADNSDSLWFSDAESASVAASPPPQEENIVVPIAQQRDRRSEVAMALNEGPGAGSRGGGTATAERPAAAIAAPVEPRVRQTARDRNSPPPAAPISRRSQPDRPVTLLPTHGRGSRKGFLSPQQKRLLLWGGALAIALLGLFVVLRALFANSVPSGLEENQPNIELETAPVEIPPPEAQIVIPDGSITEEAARQIITTWLSVKSQALGPDHLAEQLEGILAEPALSRWRAIAESLRQRNAYREYQHSVRVESLETDEADPNTATVEAAVNETSKAYQNGLYNPAASDDDNLRVRYILVRQGDRWLIEDMTVLD